MSLQSIVVMAGSQSLRARLIAAAAAHGLEDPQGFVDRSMWQLVSDDGWADAWDAATATLSRDFNPDTGMRSDVITDDMISAAVQQRAEELAAPVPSGTGDGSDG